MGAASWKRRIRCCAIAGVIGEPPARSRGELELVGVGGEGAHQPLARGLVVLDDQDPPPLVIGLRGEPITGGRAARRTLA
jgi:hypothetical protein